MCLVVTLVGKTLVLSGRVSAVMVCLPFARREATM
jgi:hypothetical protein